MRQPSTPGDQTDTEPEDEDNENEDLLEYTASIYSDQDSTVFQQAKDGFSVSGLSDPFSTSVHSLLLADDETPMPSPNPRKRNAKAASLPDSVTDSERSYGGSGSKHKATAAEHPDLSISGHSRKQSHIPRPVSSLVQARENVLKVKIPGLHQKAVLAEGNRQLEDDIPSPRDKENHPGPSHGAGAGAGAGLRNLVEGLDRSNAPSPEMLMGTVKEKVDDLESKIVRECENLSPDVKQGEFSSSSASVDSPTTVSTRMGTPSHTTDSPGDSPSLHTTGSPRGLPRLHTPNSSKDSPGESPSLIDPGLPGETKYQFDLPAHPSFAASSHSFKAGPELDLTRGVFRIRSTHDLQAAAYEVSITFLLPLKIGRPRGWWELIIPGLPRLARNEHGYVYFRTPPGQGMEFRTTHFKRYNLVESCLMAQLLIPTKLVIPLRPCEARFYGFLKDFKITQATRAEVVKCEDNDSVFHIVNYRAICSIDLLQRDFWAKKCGFYVWIHGGPEGEFSTVLPDERGRFETINLNSPTPDIIGVSELQVICNPSHLSMFVLAWAVKVPRGRTTFWMPRIKVSLAKADMEEGLQADFEDAESPTAPDMVCASPIGNELRDAQRKGTFRKRFRLICFGLVLLFVLHRLAARLHEVLCACSAAAETVIVTVTELESEFSNGTPVVEPEPELEAASLLMPAIVPTSRSLRDRVDYLLGWKGPISTTKV